MTLSDVYFRQLNALHADIVSTYERLNRLQSALDREVSALYHTIEKTDLNEITGYNAALLLQTVLRRRRIVKDEMARMKPIYDMLTANVGPTEERYRKTAAKSDEMRRSINVTLKIEDIGGFAVCQPQ